MHSSMEKLEKLHIKNWNNKNNDSDNNNDFPKNNSWSSTIFYYTNTFSQVI